MVEASASDYARRFQFRAPRERAIAQGRITRIRRVHDTAELRKAGFAA
jgi:hypothetical protein